MWTKVTRIKTLPIQGCRMPQLWKTWSHIALVSRSPKKKPQSCQQSPKKTRLGTKYVTSAEDKGPESVENEESLSLYTVGGVTTPPMKVPLTVNGKSFTMELDRAAVTIVLERTHSDLFPNLPTQKSDVLLKTYTREQLPVIGDVSVHVQ